METIENLETKLINLQNNIELLQKNMNLADIEQNDSLTQSKTETKKNSLEIKQLEKQVGDLKVRLKRRQMNDLKLMQETMSLKFKDPSYLKANSAKELLENIESRVRYLHLQCQTQLHTLKHLECTFNEEKNQLEKMNQTCDANNKSSEANCIQQRRHLENVQYKTIRNIEDCESAREKMKRMFKIVQKKQNSQLRLLADLKDEQLGIQNSNTDVKEDLKKNKDADEEEKEKEYEKIKNDIALIKDAIYHHDDDDIDLEFLEQKTINNDLKEMIKKAEKHLYDLKEEKNDIALKKSLIKEVDSVYPKSNEDLFLARSRLKEQQVRLDLAKEEMDRVNSHTNSTKEVFQKLLVRMHPKVNKAEMNKKDVLQLSKQLENIVHYTFQPSEKKFSNRN